MKKIFFLFLISVCLFSNSFSQSGWIVQNSGTNQDLWAINFFDQNIGWAAGKEGALIKTTNGGSTWEPVTTNTDAWFTSIFFLDQIFGWVVGPDYTVSGSSGCLLKTTNGGLDWILDTFQDPFFKVIFEDQNIGWAVGFNGETYPNYYGIVWKTTDGGETWIEKTSSPAPSSYWDMCFVNNTTGWVVGENSPNGIGIIKKTTDGGESWIDYTNPFQGHLETIVFVDDQIGWILGDYLLLHTTNSGEDWFNQNSSVWGEDMFFVDESVGWIVRGYSPSILKTTDAGVNWFVQNNPTSLVLNSIFFLNNTKGWIVGNNGTILHTSDGGGITFINNEIETPDQFSVSQNYPNPFNPTTTIAYHITQTEFVTLKVYDILGREVATLVNEEKSAGSYEVQFTANGLTSGIYFYQLNTGKYSETKKMILLR